MLHSILLIIMGVGPMGPQFYIQIRTPVFCTKHDTIHLKNGIETNCNKPEFNVIQINPNTYYSWPFTTASICLTDCMH
jgi:hypothetical protein